MARFLVVTKPSSPFPLEMAMGLVEGMKQWIGTHRASGKMEQVWAFAGSNGGGGVVNVESHEELDAIMAGFPFAPWSSIEVLPLADLDSSLANFEAVIKQMMPPQ